ncbi:unnamed protein product [Lota lota]
MSRAVPGLHRSNELAFCEHECGITQGARGSEALRRDPATMPQLLSGHVPVDDGLLASLPSSEPHGPSPHPFLGGSVQREAGMRDACLPMAHAQHESNEPGCDEPATHTISEMDSQSCPRFHYRPPPSDFCSENGAECDCYRQDEGGPLCSPNDQEDTKSALRPDLGPEYLSEEQQTRPTARTDQTPSADPLERAYAGGPHGAALKGDECGPEAVTHV